MEKFNVGNKVKILTTTAWQRDSYEMFDNDIVEVLVADDDGDVIVKKDDYICNFNPSDLELVPEYTTFEEASKKIVREAIDRIYEKNGIYPSEEPKKYNAGKPRTDLISGEFTLALGEALGYGADKYGEVKGELPNYLKGDGHYYSNLIGSLERHLANFKAGVNIDEESGLEHIILVAVNAMFLYNYRVSDKGVDDRVVLKELK